MTGRVSSRERTLENFSAVPMSLATLATDWRACLGVLLIGPPLFSGALGTMLTFPVWR